MNLSRMHAPSAVWPPAHGARAALTDLSPPPIDVRPLGSRRRLLRGVFGCAGLATAWPCAAAMPTLRATDADAPLQRSQHEVFGSPAQLILPRHAPARVVQRVWGMLDAMHRRLNAWKPGDLEDLNAALRRGRVTTVTPSLAALLRLARDLEIASGGRFNPAIGAWVRGWGFHADRLRDDGMAPDASQLAAWRSATPSLQQLRFDGPRVVSHNPAVQIDLNACAKGVALDGALDLLAREGITHALLDLGGNLATLGTPTGRHWRIGIHDPTGGAQPLAQLATSPAREAVVTSGVDERYRVYDGQRLGHVIDPATATPARALRSVTVAHAHAARADAASTALLVAGPAAWRATARAMQVDDVLVVDAQGRVDATESMARRLVN